MKINYEVINEKGTFMMKEFSETLKEVKVDFLLDNRKIWNEVKKGIDIIDDYFNKVIDEDTADERIANILDEYLEFPYLLKKIEKMYERIMQMKKDYPFAYDYSFGYDWHFSDFECIDKKTRKKLKDLMINNNVDDIDLFYELNDVERNRVTTEMFKMLITLKNVIKAKYEIIKQYDEIKKLNEDLKGLYA